MLQFLTQKLKINLFFNCMYTPKYVKKLINFGRNRKIGLRLLIKYILSVNQRKYWEKE